MASRGRGAKAKGSRLERKVAEILRHSGLDPNASRMPLSGADSHLKGDVRTDLPYTIECKNTERVQLWKAWEQTVEQAHYNAPLLFISSNHRPVVAVMDMDTLVHLLKCEQQLEHHLAVRHDYRPKVHDEDSFTNRVQKKPASKWKRKVDGTVVERE